MGSFYVYLIMAFSIVDGAKRLPSIFILQSTIFNIFPYPGSGALETAAGRDEFDADAASFCSLLSDR
jgi:hypothetical protein